MTRTRIPRRGLAALACCLLAACVLFAHSTPAEEIDSSAPSSLGEDTYQELKAAGALPQPEETGVPVELRPENIMYPEEIVPDDGFLGPEEEVFQALRERAAEPVPHGAWPSEAERGYPEGDTKCGTPQAIEQFRGGLRQPRPTLSGPVINIDSANFRIHYTTQGADATTAAYANNVSTFAENSWTVEVTNEGWDAPPGDGTAGGNALYDIYILDIAALGVTHPESPGPDPAQEDYISYVEVDIGIGTDLLRVTVAHEFNHACQFSYTAFDAIWWYENTATWMEDVVYDGVNDYVGYLSGTPSPTTTPEDPITETGGNYEYGGAIWAMYLAEVYGTAAPRQAWERMGTNTGDHTIADLEWMLVNHHTSSLKKALENYAVWRYFTGTRDDGRHFSEGSTFPEAAVLRTHNAFPVIAANQGTRAPSGPGGVNYVQFEGGSGYLAVDFDGQDGSAWQANLIGYRTATAAKIERMHLTAAGQVGLAVIGWDGYIRLVLVAAVTEWSGAAASLTHKYDAHSSFSVAPFTNGAPPLYRNDDGSTSPIPLSFPFCFYGTDYSQVYINNNGNLSFEGPYSQFTPTGFPVSGYGMAAPFWADVDTRNGQSGVVYYRSEPNRFTVIWDRVGYYGSHADKLNAFKVILTDGTDDDVGIGNNIGFRYADMQWTTGDASGGSNGFGGSPATVGVNQGDGTNYALVGRFDHEGIDYDGPGGGADGVSYLDGPREFNYDICQGLGTISGTVFNDVNGNGSWDAGESGLPGWTITLNPGGLATLSDGDGEYFFSFLDPNTYTVAEVLKTNWEQTAPPPPGTYVVNLNAGQTVTDRDFGNRALANVQDLSVSVAGGRARPGFQKFYGITYENKGTIETAATVSLSLPSEVSHLESSPGGTYAAGTHSVTWDVGSLAPGYIGWLWTKVQIPVAIPLGTVLTSTAQIDPTAGDANPADNTDTESQTVTGSFDPNDKLVMVPYEILVTDTLRYHVNFQNVGTDTAFTVILRDTLDIDLDVATVVTGASIHPYVFQLIGRELSWTFADIRLPHSGIDEPGSHGFVTFKVLPLPGVPVGTELANRAAVYFDFNPPVITNTVYNLIVEPSLVAAVDIKPGSCPNPLNIRSQGVLPVAILGSDDFDVSDVDPTTVLLEGVAPVRWGFGDVATPADPSGDPCDCTAEGPDGFVDLTLKFKTQELVASLQEHGPLEDGEERTLVLTAAMLAGMPFDGQDCVLLLRKGREDRIVGQPVQPPEKEPRVYDLRRNYPNPFRDHTIIAFSVPNPTHVSLIVYDLSGRRITSLVDTEMSAGSHRVAWDGTDDTGNRVASGVYLYRLETGGFEKTMKMILIE